MTGKEMMDIMQLRATEMELGKARATLAMLVSHSPSKELIASLQAASDAIEAAESVVTIEMFKRDEA